MTVEQFLNDKMPEILKSFGYDGLYYDGPLGADDCGCGIEELAPCGNSLMGCEPAYKWPNGEWYPDKPEVKDD